MKQIKCLDCDELFQAETKEAAMQKMHPHYMSDHKDVMAAGTEEQMKAWFKKFDEDWKAAPEV